MQLILIITINWVVLDYNLQFKNNMLFNNTTRCLFWKSGTVCIQNQILFLYKIRYCLYTKSGTVSTQNQVLFVHKIGYCLYTKSGAVCIQLHLRICDVISVMTPSEYRNMWSGNSTVKWTMWLLLVTGRRLQNHSNLKYAFTAVVSVPTICYRISGLCSSLTQRVLVFSVFCSALVDSAVRSYSVFLCSLWSVVH
jgi:hypothetical protein